MGDYFKYSTDLSKTKKFESPIVLAVDLKVGDLPQKKDALKNIFLGDSRSSGTTFSRPKKNGLSHFRMNFSVYWCILAIFIPLSSIEEPPAKIMILF